MGSLYDVDGTTGNITTAGSITSTSTTSGFLLPRMTTTQRNAISSPATGLEIFNTTTNQSEFWNGSSWTAVGGSGTPAGSNTQIQYNNSGAFGASADFTFANDNLTITSAVNPPAFSLIDTSGTNGTSIALASNSTSSIVFQNQAQNVTSASISNDYPSGDLQLSSQNWNWIFGADGGLQYPLLTADPGSPTESQQYYNSTSHVYKYWNGTTWVTVSGGGGVSVLASVSQINQNLDIPTTTLYTVPSNGLFQINGYITTSIADATAGNLSLNWNWTDDGGSESYGNEMQISLTSLGTQGTAGLPLTIQANTGSVIQFNISNSGSYGSATYSYYVSVIKVN
jgi:hypothetical protein